jgi:hypothetical protein
MSELPQLETRITAALDRIKSGLDGLSVAVIAPEPEADGADVSALTLQVAELGAKLDEEQTANSQLEERETPQGTARWKAGPAGK